VALFNRAATPADPEGRMSFMEHLGELRTRIVRGLVALLVGLLITLPFSEKIVDFLARPIKKMGHTLIFTSPTEAFWVQMKVALIAGLFLAAPGILWQVWRFVEPGLHPQEKKYAIPFILWAHAFHRGGPFAAGDRTR
jgi:sec-independent protein translocase protein TatC